MSIWGAGAAVVGAGIGAYGASQSGGDAQGSELPWYIKDPTKAYFSKLSPYKPGGEPRNHGGFWGQYDPKVFQGDRTASAPDWMVQDMRDYRDSGTDPNSAMGLSEQFYKDQVAGDYLGMNSAMQASVVDPAMDASASRFAKMGRSGINPANVQSMNSSAMSALMPFHNQALNRQMDAASALPGFDRMRMDRSSMLGNYQTQQSQNKIDDKMYRHDFKQNRYLNQMQQWQGLLNPNTNPTQTVTQPEGDWLSGALSGGLAGYELYNQYQDTPSNVQYGDRYSAGVGTSGGNGIDALNLSFGAGG